jgi:hypothetical protein
MAGGVADHAGAEADQKDCLMQYRCALSELLPRLQKNRERHLAPAANHLSSLIADSNQKPQLELEHMSGKCCRKSRGNNTVEESALQSRGNLPQTAECTGSCHPTSAA